jgi:hypothetical protein
MEQLARDRWVYKNGRSDDVRRAPRLGPAAVLWRSLAVHERCLVAAAGDTSFSVVTTVPSTSGSSGVTQRSPIIVTLGAIVISRAGRWAGSPCCYSMIPGPLARMPRAQRRHCGRPVRMRWVPGQSGDTSTAMRLASMERRQRRTTGKPERLAGTGNGAASMTTGRRDRRQLPRPGGYR